MAKNSRKPVENSIIILSAAIFAVSFGLYVTDFPLRYYILGIEEDSTGEKIGHVATSAGSIKQKKSGDGVFLKASRNSPIFKDDTIATGPESKATLNLDEGGTIDIGPNSMLRLSAEKSFSFGGISRVPTIEVVSGEIKTTPANNREIVLKAEGKRIKVTDAQQEPIRVSPPKPLLEIRKKSELQLTASNEVNIKDIGKSPSPTPTPIPVPSPTPSPTPTPTPTPSISRSPAPVPFKLQMLKPDNNEAIHFTDPTTPEGRKVDLVWMVQPKDKPLILSVYKLDKDSKWTKLSEREVIAQNGRGSRTITIDSPGKYSWILVPKNAGQETAKTKHEARFSVNAEFQGMEMPEALVAGESNDSNEFREKIVRDFDLKLKWKAFPNATTYKIKLASDQDLQKKTVEKEIQGTEWVLNKNKVYQGTTYAKISTVLTSGFIATSPVRSFTFKFLPPELSFPPDQEKISKKTVLGNKQGGVLLTWRITNFTDFYELEVATDAEFKNVTLKQNLKENFFTLKSLKTGQYWWRVRSISKTTVSNPSRARSFSLND
jgi:hypothetical protein